MQSVAKCSCTGCERGFDIIVSSSALRAFHPWRYSLSFRYITHVIQVCEYSHEITDNTGLYCKKSKSISIKSPISKKEEKKTHMYITRNDSWHVSNENKWYKLNRYAKLSEDSGARYNASTLSCVTWQFHINILIFFATHFCKSSWFQFNALVFEKYHNT